MQDKNTSSNEMDRHINVFLGKIKKFLPVDSPADILIIKAHLICEYYINQILLLKGVSTPKEIDSLTFYQKIEKAFNKSDENQKNIFDRLSRLNKLRNKVGHELEYSLSESDIDNLGVLIGKEYIIKKYDFESLQHLLQDTLKDIALELSADVFHLVNVEKKKYNKGGG